MRSPAEYRILFEAAPDAMVVFDEIGRILLLNRRAESQFGYARNDLVGQSIAAIIPQGLLEDLSTDRMRAAAADLWRQVGRGIEVQARRSDGTEFPIEIMLSPLHGDHGILVTASIRDISVRKVTEQLLAESDRPRFHLAALVESSDDAILSKSLDGTILSWNSSAERLYGYSAAEIVGRSISVLVPPDRPNEVTEILERIRAGEPVDHFDTVRVARDGTLVPVSLTISPITDADGTIIGASTIARDIRLRQETDAFRAMALQMTHSAHHDFLTGLPNRMLLNDRISQAIALAPRHHNQVAVLFLDLDGFKYINDSLGHSIGDKLLQSVAARLVECVRTSDTVSRQGGDEFVVLLSEAEHWEDAATVAARMLKAVAEPHVIDRGDLHVTTSIGVSVFPDDGQDAETLIKNADTAMYQAKENGRHSFQFFKPAMNVRAVERQSTEESLRRALEREEFVLYYQPKVSLGTGLITGAEALIRWVHPERGLVAPLQFIPIAEDCGLIRPIGNWVLREACRQAQAWLDAGTPVSTMAVNVSAMELRDDRFLGGLMDVLDETGLGPESLEVELTESVLMRHADSAAKILQALRERGVHVAVDDFGTGYSSLSYLRKFPIDALKIDQSFVNEITPDNQDTSIVTAVISMARSLRMRVIAEGVETTEQLAFLRQRKCDEGQGYYFSRPVPQHQFAELLRTGIPAHEDAMRA